MNNRVVITGLGVVSSIGIGWQGFWKGLLQGISGISPISSFDTTDHHTHLGGEVKNFRPEEFINSNRLPYMNRATQMALAAVILGIADAKLTKEKLSRYRVGISHGTTLGALQTIEDINTLLMDGETIDVRYAAQMPTHAPTSVIAQECNANGPVAMFSTACSAGNYAICGGYDMIKLGRADIVLAGASDAISRIEYTGFNQLGVAAPGKCQPFDANRKGMILAEGAAILILESLECACVRRAPIYAEISGYGLSCDAHHMTNPGKWGIVECIKKALYETGTSIEEVDYISAHGTGTPANDRTECTALEEVFGSHLSQIPVSSIKSMLGHAMGAASALEAATCALSIKYGRIPPTINLETLDPECRIDCVPNKSRNQSVSVTLNNSYAFGGNNISMVLRKLIQ